MEANLDHNPSFIWRSIYSSQVVVKHALGGVWEMVKASLHGMILGYAILTTRDSLEDLRVCELIEPTTKTWPNDDIQHNFNSSDAARFYPCQSIL